VAHRGSSDLSRSWTVPEEPVSHPALLVAVVATLPSPLPSDKEHPSSFAYGWLPDPFRGGPHASKTMGGCWRRPFVGRGPGATHCFRFDSVPGARPAAGRSELLGVGRRPCEFVDQRLARRESYLAASPVLAILLVKG
jgi:hypothetical protein